MEVRPLRAGEVEEIRALRLRAVADAPFAFSSSHERELRRPDDFWQHLARQSDEALTGVTYVAVHGDQWVGMAGVFITDNEPNTGQIWGTWVDPASRRAGIGHQLMESIRAWAVTRGLRHLRLSVTDSERSAPARRLYAALGFQSTGDQEPLDSDPSLRADVMTLALSADQADRRP
jgi:GNAT superfamily N-acetyltransferase